MMKALKKFNVFWIIIFIFVNTLLVAQVSAIYYQKNRLYSTKFTFLQVEIQN